MAKQYKRRKDIEKEGEIYRYCNSCEGLIILQLFTKNKLCSLGRERTCSECAKRRITEAQKKQYRLTNNKKSWELYHADIDKSRALRRKQYADDNINFIGKKKSRKVNRENREYHIEYKQDYQESEKSKIKHLKKTEEWRVKNKAKMLAHAKVYGMISTGKIKKPFKCPLCNKKTNSRKMYLRLDDNLDYKNPHWACSFCSGTQTISDNIEKGLD